MKNIIKKLMILLFVINSLVLYGQTTTTLSVSNLTGAVTYHSSVTFPNGINLIGTTSLNDFTLTNISEINEQFNETSSGLPSGWSYTLYGGEANVPARNGSGLLMTNSFGGHSCTWVYYTNLYNGAHNYHIHADVSILQTNGVANVFCVGTKSGNPNDDASSVLFFYPQPGSYTGTMGLYNGPSTNLLANRNDDTLASGTAYPMSVALGTFYGIDLQVDDDSLYAIASNKTTGQLSTFAWKQDVSTSGVTNGYFGSSGYFGMMIFGGSYLVTNFTVTLNVPKKIRLMFQRK